MTRQRIVIAGAGIGGLATAAALGHNGGDYDIEIYERADAVRGLAGSGLTIWGNAVAALGRVGLGDAVKELGSPLESQVVVTDGGSTLTEAPIGRFQREHADIGVGIRRQALLDMLLRAVGPDRVRYEERVVGYRATGDGDGVDVLLQSGGAVRADILIGADGLRSAIRRQMLGDGDPTPLKHMVWRGISDSSAHFPAETVLMVYGAHATRMVAWPVDDDSVCWSIGRNGTPARDSASPAVLKEQLLSFIDGFPKANRHILENTPAERLIRTDLFARKRLNRLVDGRVALLGDAGHAMPTVFGQGACMAIEDAVVLADCLADAPSDQTPDAGLREYERRRLPRLEWVREQVFKVSRYQEWESPLLVTMRNTVMRTMPASRQEAMWRRMFAFDPGRPAEERADAGH
ncbi:FAD-dependent monooxygenase [Actinomadura spongiicola]|uniref:FAD-dependent monooxygenase n=1 Tax=Actinomadura spongiicola TaxID=2303421 RepID=UPI001313E977|nr:FAD-dependent monooxygenase [Actinomadura spongiicola]